jgi:electron transport complex protein RnfD
MELLKVSGSPHVHTDSSIPSIMYGVVYAMVPAILISVYFFGLDALRIILISVVSCMIVEALLQKYVLKTDVTINDGSAIVAGVLLAFNVPANLPWWIMVIGAIVTIGVGKMSFGGLGKNIFNPALVGRIFLLISFPVQMTTWPIPKPLFAERMTDAVTGPTPLAIMKEGLAAGKTVEEIMPEIPNYVENLMVGFQGGCVGEVSAFALILGALYMLFRRIISWHIPFSYIGGAVVFSGILWLANPDYYVDPLFHLVTGGMMLGVFYMATDMVSSPMSNKGQLIYGAGCGVLTILIRVFGAYPEGVAFSILIMNAFVPVIDRGLKPVRFGELVKSK